MHIIDEFQIRFGVLIGMAVWAVRAICKRTEVVVVFPAPTVKVLPVGPVLLGSFSNAILIII